MRYYLEDLEGNPTITQLKRNAPNRRRERQRFFATDLLPVDSSSVDENDKDGFDNTQAHYINRLDEATATDKARRRPPKPTRPARQRRQTPPKPADDDPAVQPERLQEIERQVADLTAKQLSAVVTGDVVKNAELAKTMRGMSENEKMALLKSGADRITRSRAKTGSGIMIGGSFYDWK